MYTKIVLTVIATMLSVVAVNRLEKPATAVGAASEQVSFAVGPGGYVYIYDAGANVVKVYQPTGEPSTEIHLH